MENTLLQFSPVIERPDLVPDTVFNTINNWTGTEQKDEFLVAEIDPEFAGGVEVCEKYNIDPKSGANCLVVNGTRGDKKTTAACLVPVGYRYDMNGAVRKALNARQVSVASLEEVMELSHMEYGSITPVGLPSDWFLFIDPKVLETERLVIGGGLKKSKLSIPSKALLSLPNATVLEGLAKAQS
jgi:prolyl-tRNA editing enzyme YbaK/EbsC (Cys-tRNA(Pro) deacylase)